MFALVHMEKTGGLTLNFILRNSFGIHHFDVYPWANDRKLFEADDLKLLLKFAPKIKSIAGHSVNPRANIETICNNIQYYTVMRHPLIRCASHYQYQVNVMG
jgi:hypothetical protein